LLIQPGDIRHIIHTIANRRKHQANWSEPLRPIHFYLLENPLEILSRDLVELQVFCDFEIPIRQRANVFLEIFGNCKIQKRTSKYIEQISFQLQEIMKNSSKGRNSSLYDILDFSCLRFRERDGLELALRNLATTSFSTSFPANTTSSFDMHSLLDHRHRGLYQDRFDSRKALFDWDYHAGLKGRASIIHIKQYKGAQTLDPIFCLKKKYFFLLFEFRMETIGHRF
jgi:dynein assembly factor 3